MIETQRLSKTYGRIRAVDEVSFRVEPGQVLGFLGPNGAGKSTTMKMIAGFLTPTSGTAKVCGFDVREQSIEARRALGYLSEGAPSYGEMTVWGFLGFIADVRGLSGERRRQRLDDAIGRLQLEGVLTQPIDTLSKGFRRRVGLAQAILHNPPVLIMDEPTDGLDPNQKYEVRKLISRMAADKAIIISTHILEEVDAICTRALIIDRGRVVADGTPAELIARSRYHNAVSLTVGGQVTIAAAEALKALPGIASIEINPRGTETTFTLFPLQQSAITAEVKLIDAVADLAREKDWTVRSLYGEPGRLDEVFRKLTRSDTADASGKNAA